ncbi:uncharacterized protein EV154DRAFT_553755 [Mucor mucedo]|uniref:uncharacterized protein n=1 Tax=Mucor mucedo TaxID=29922 RepID=UPI0022207F93|nr:uncharacterized protein EV154DRAFT_553755 [Mucor mucedo]KAI7888533.1 hypothetical protein EV154DRAFT_553755 [Mucor mucedo]
MVLAVVCIASFGFQYNNLTGACRPLCSRNFLLKLVPHPLLGGGCLKPVDTFLVIGVGVGCYLWSGSDDSRRFSARMHLVSAFALFTSTLEILHSIGSHRLAACWTVTSSTRNVNLKANTRPGAAATIQLPGMCFHLLVVWPVNQLFYVGN